MRRTDAADVLPPTPVKTNPLAALTERRKKTEKQLLTAILLRHNAESKLTALGPKKIALEQSEEENWEIMVDLRAKKKRAGLTAEESYAIDAELRIKTGNASSISQAATNVLSQMAEVQARIPQLRRSTQQLQDEVGVLTAEIDQLYVDSSSIRPKQTLTRLPVTRMDQVT